MSVFEWDGHRGRFLMAGCLLAIAFLYVRIDQVGDVDSGSLDELSDLHASVDAGTSSRRLAYLAIGAAGLAALVWPRRDAIRAQRNLALTDQYSTNGTPCSVLSARYSVFHANDLRMRGSLAVLGLAFVAWCSLTVLWSEDMAFAIRRLSVFFCVLLAALGAVRQFSWRQILLLGLFASGVQFTGSLAASILRGTFQPWTGDYRFSGLLHPNHEAINCAVLLITAFFLARDARRGKTVLYSIALTAVAFLMLTRSRTAVVAALAACALTWWGTASRKTRLVSFFAAVTAVSLGCIVLGGWASDNAGRVIEMGREEADTSTLVGRLPLWDELLPYVWRRPLASYGYNAFWTPDRIETIAESQGWAVSHAHSDYLDVLLGAGFIGLALYVALLADGIRVTSIRASREVGMCGLPAWTWFTAIGGFTEGIGHQNYLFQFMLLAALAYAATRADGDAASSAMT